MTRDGAAAARVAHNHEVPGSSPGPATKNDFKTSPEVFLFCYTWHMKRLKLWVLVAALVWPILTVFIFDARYSSLQDSVCASSQGHSNVRYACDFPERNERERIVTTAFYRHVGNYFGREEGTSPSWLDVASYSDYDLKNRIGRFNFSFAVSFLLSVIVASVSATLLVQMYIQAQKTKD